MSRENVEVIRRLMDAFNRADVKAARDLWATDAEWRPAYLGGGLLEGAVYRGHEGITEFIELQAEIWQSIVAEAVEIQDLGDQMLMEVQLRGVGRSGGVPVDRTTWNVFTVRDGKVAGGRVYTSKQEAYDAAGLRE